MKEGLRALLTGVIDYAGLFPPAKLPLDEAIRNYARYRTDPEAWMLGRFIIPTTRLTELNTHADLFASGSPFAFSVLGRGGDTADAFRAGLRLDLEAVAAFRDRHPGKVVVDAYEVKLPADVLRRPRQDFFEWAADTLAGARMVGFFEPTPGAEWSSDLFGLGSEMTGTRAGLKLRCGGLDAAAFPTPEQVALAIMTSRVYRLPLKCTAGLHHPIRRFDAGVATFMHGFVNVFLAGALSHVHRLRARQLEPLLREESPAAIGIGDEGLRWREYRLSVEEITRVRRDGILSFGSCSFDEPRDDLRALGWL